MTGNIVARRYAKALFAMGKKKGLDELKTYGKDLDALAQVLEDSPELLRVFRNPIFSADEKRTVVEKVLGQAGVSNIVKNFCFLLADKDRLAELPDIAAVYSAQLDEEDGVVRGQLITAVELAGDKQEAVKAKLESQSGRKLVLDFGVDPAILGGVVVKVGERVMDASLRAQLDMMKENIKRGE
ncbi:MAG: F0F1 ATP synthase subunit delta [Desulfovibrio sp.]|nr:MAG: F0F1 ATP synthase subunit delta [Desulfovibrio sp.]